MFRYIKKKVKNLEDESGGNDMGQMVDNMLTNLSGRSPAIKRTLSGGGRSRSGSDYLAEQQQYLDTHVLSQQVEHLAKFDACVEACDALAASTAVAHASSRRDPKTGLIDCTVLVSPDGGLLLMPQNSQSAGLDMSGGGKNEAKETEGNDLDTSSTHLMELGQEYESAIYLGNDLDPNGDRGLNGFSANGWSIPATSLALRQTEQSLHDFADFCEEIVLSKKESAARDNLACDKLRAASFERGPFNPPDLQEDAVLMKTNVPFEVTTQRVGPMLYNGGTLHAAQVALEEFFATMAESESDRWRLASLQRKGALPALRKAATNAEERSANRQKTLREMYNRVKMMEDHLAECKLEAQAKWMQVDLAEQKVTQLVEERMKERSRLREDQRMKEFHQQAGDQQDATGNAAANAADIWSIVSQVTESMENGSFEPINYQQSTLPANSSGGGDKDVSPSAQLQTLSASPSSDFDEGLPVTDRMDIEDEVGMPELRAAAFAADKAAQDASESLLNVLSTLDQVKRSARVAAETNILSACNAQAACIRSVVRLERAAAEERLKRIEEMERIVDKIDVRQDLDKYITNDRKRPGGSAPLGQDDDGGIASALAVLTSHVEGDMGDAPSPKAKSAYEDNKKESIAATVNPEALEEAIEVLFKSNEFLNKDAVESNEKLQAVSEFNKAVKLLCDVAREKSLAARPRRSRMCYALNSKRASNKQIKTPLHFDALCKIFAAILSGCDTEAGGVSNAKMCMMLSQTFFFSEEPEKGDGPEENEKSEKRCKRIYVKNRLTGHPLWAREDFWDQVLFQCLSESLTNSGVMSNFERLNATQPTSNHSQMRESRKMQWYDLSPIERTEAASQVHAVVFAQLGSLAHSMIEFGCGLERSCAFVRRMAIRNQLPLSQRTILLQHLVERQRNSSTDTKPEMGIFEALIFEEDEIEGSVSENSDRGKYLNFCREESPVKLEDSANSNGEGHDGAAETAPKEKPGEESAPNNEIFAVISEDRPDHRQNSDVKARSDAAPTTEPNDKVVSEESGVVKSENSSENVDLSTQQAESNENFIEDSDEQY